MLSAPQVGGSALLDGFAALDRNHVGADRPNRQRSGQAGGHVDVGEVTVQQQHLDQRPGAGSITESSAGRGPKSVVGGGEHPGRTSVSQSGRTGQRTGLAGQHLQVVVQNKDLPVAGRGVFMAGDLDSAIEDDQPPGAEVDPDPTADQPGRHRVLALSHADPGVAVDPRGECQPGRERLERHRPQRLAFEGDVVPDRHCPVGDPAVVVLGVRSIKQHVEVCE
ncbi:hypothetical protein [Actinopolymorpha sp. B9G3]|uniref:hypothetical protein n=1 Tax=Actinopolymorpha sp. B9G3 TaxID=3158970 RepID=UPI0032D9531D